ncbi:MAG TPA: ABC transporter ATP-binding protein, partial [Pararhizobium sp.]|nr:ABC transporter ATP-binding protein [Pararhizobium sp.]
MNALSFDDVTIALGRRRVLDGVSFAVPEGRFVGVLGPNGAGKTTVMRAALGLVAPASGRIAVLGRPPRRGDPLIGYMPQQRGLSAGGRLSVRDYLVASAAGGRWGRPFADRQERQAVDSALERVAAGHLAARPLTELSGGERQRIFIAQALMGDPKLLVLDEPLVGLDPRHQRAIVDLVRAVARERGIAVLFSAHEINPILPAADLILYLGNGQAAVGPVDAVINREVLSRLYGTPVHVARVNDRIFVMAEDCELESHADCGG